MKENTDAFADSLLWREKLLSFGFWYFGPDTLVHQ